MAKHLWLILFLWIEIAAYVFGSSTTEPQNHPQETLEKGMLWVGELRGYECKDYQEALSFLIPKIEAVEDIKLHKGKKGKVGLKVYTHSGKGLHTPCGLVKAIMAFLETRGYQKKDIFIIDLWGYKLRECGFLPPLGSGLKPEFEGVRVYSIDEDKAITHPDWYYDNPAAPLYGGSGVEISGEESRKSYLPYILIENVDFWINLPVGCGMPGIGFSGALVNSSLCAVTNQDRFFRNPRQGAVAIAEINAIPEMREGLILNLLSLEKYQFIGGPNFRAYYTRSEPKIVLSTQGLMIDGFLFELMNKQRIHSGFKPMSALPMYMEYCQSLIK